MSDIIDIDNIRFAFTESDYFQREVERSVNELILKNNGFLLINIINMIFFCWINFFSMII